jgi:predicted transcriptional regulator
MLPQKLDTTLAHKGIALCADLSGTDKRVAAAIIDSFNHKTGQCDPGFGRLAHLLCISRRTVIRAIKKIESVGIIRRIRHGGKSHRNCYLPNWIRFREIEAAWNARQKTRHWQSASNLSPLNHEKCHLAGVQGVTQTIPNNQSNSLTRPRLATQASTKPSDASNALSVADRQSKKPKISHGPALAAAERRWSTDLHNRYSQNHHIYAQIIEAIDLDMQKAATQAEVRRRGAGLRHIETQVMEAVLARSALRPEPNGGDVDAR